MNLRLKTFIVFATMAVLTTACTVQSAQVEHREQAGSYQTVLGKSLDDKDVVNFIVSHDCQLHRQFEICKDIGLAFWINASHIVKTVYLFSGNSDGFRRYRDELPFGLTFYDPMWLVEEKLSNLGSDDTIQTYGKAGLPDEGSSPDHMHYWATYKRFGMTIIYNSPVADEDAYIYAILVNG